MEIKYWILITLSLILGAGLITGCVQKIDKQPQPYIQGQVQHQDWTRNAVLYEVNVRQYTPEGTFNSFARHLPRLKQMGVDIIWLMPINPIGEKDRKGTLGSYYSVKDYTKINPEFGTMDDLKALVKATHEQGMKIIIDWVPNHTSWDNVLTKTNPDFFMHDSTGKYISPFDWTDVIRLDYKNPALRHYMISTMQWWLKETDIDGFRCDVAHMIPQDFWDECRPALDSIKSIFFLAESDQPFLHEKAFDATYDWKFHHIMNEIAQGKMPASAVKDHFVWADSAYPSDSYLLQFTSNHDENSWNGTEFERMGEGARTFAVLAGTVRDMLLIYSGQESAFNRRLQFFEKDSISWGDYSLSDFYAKLINLKKTNKVLWNGDAGSRMHFLSTGSDSSCVAFIRSNGTDKILAIFNLSNTDRKADIKSEEIEGNYKEVFSGSEQSVSERAKFTLKPWEYLILESKGQ